MKKILNFILAIMLCGLFFTACDDSFPEDLIGTWSDSDVTSATGSTRYLSLTLRSDKTGTFTFESSVYIRKANFTWSYKNDIVTCSGVMVEYEEDSGVDTDENWERTFLYNGTTLIPQQRPYQNFKLTK